MTTANDVCSGALRLACSLMPGEGIPGAEAEHALTVLNGMVAAWSADGYMPPARTIENFTLGQGVGSQTVGVGAQINTVRPDSVNYVYLRDAANVDYMLEPMSQRQYDAIPTKLVASRPRRYYFDPQYPNAVLYFDFVTDKQYTIYLDSLKPLTQFSSLSATLDLPGEYYEAMKYQLAKRLAPEYGFPWTPELDSLAAAALARVKRKNVPKVAAMFDMALLHPRPFDINAG